MLETTLAEKKTADWFISLPHAGTAVGRPGSHQNAVEDGSAPALGIAGESGTDNSEDRYTFAGMYLFF